ncbi:MAG TPA: substrate-binding domain-containing protein [Burkholderiaceae bacterium]|nr:substrate-binding domain-containing protein [Burkholderiaceae bacterium]
MKTISKPGRESASATLLEVAREAGVSAATVSRILNGSSRVSAEKRQAVERAIKALNFKPNLLAQSLKRGRSMTVGVLTQDIGSPFFAEALLGIEAALEHTDYEPLIASGHWNPGEEADRIRRLVARQVDGVIVLFGHLADDALAQFAEHVPIIATGHQFTSPRAISFRLDSHRGGYLATRHLLDLGHRDIAHIAGPSDHADAVERLTGYRQALDEAGVRYDERLVVEGNFKEPGGVIAANRLLDSGVPFTAIFAANDQTAFGARLALYRRGIRVPEDVSLIGFDDLPSALYTTPPLTTVRQPMFEVGQQAAAALLKLIEGEPARVEVPELTLVVRETTRRLR